MSIQNLKDRLPEYAKDLKLNLSSLAGESVLNEAQKAGTFIATAIASRNPEVIRAILAEFADKLEPAALNAANETAVAAFLGGRIRFTDIAAACEAAMQRTPTRALASLDDARDADAQARAHAAAWLAGRPVQGTVAA